MSASLAGGLVGLGFAVIEYLVFGGIIARYERQGIGEKRIGMIDLMRKGFLVVYPVIGWFVGPVVAESFGAL